MNLWPHQQYAIGETWRRIDDGEESLVVCSPTGGGKTHIICETIHEALRRGMKVAVYSNRIMLIEQTAKDMLGEGIQFGWRMSGKEVDVTRDVQLCSMKTIVTQRDKMPLPEADITLVDECHQQKGLLESKILKKHAAGGPLIGYSATPVDLWHIYKGIIRAGLNSELRDCGAILPAITYAPDEPDLSEIKRDCKGEYPVGEVVKRIMISTIFGRVWDHWIRLNPAMLPTILFAPDIPSSKWFAVNFVGKGVEAAHIAGDSIWCRGVHGYRDYESTPSLRQEIKEKSKDGTIKVVCNRFVLRVGINWKHLAHGIAATVFGREDVFCQVAGRILRTYDGLSNVIWQDHGGNYWRHGSVNADRYWKAGDTDSARQKRRRKALKHGKEKQPIVCPRCSHVRKGGGKCPQCGHKHVKSVRHVVQANGNLKKQYGTPIKVKNPVNPNDPQRKWDTCYWRARNARGPMTFVQARGLYFKEYGELPPYGLARMPPEGSTTWNRIVKKTPYHELNSKRNQNAAK